ncbi:MAG: DUF488 domain-containing protein, partial [Paracoccus sp. (in: a-proteobacteria)]|nr:DUF488 domain-containing protein [Paracoccus sp. (in: a-proteobacteria)]
NRSLSEFTGLIASAGIACVLDIRKMPMSRANPQFNKDSLAGALRECGVAYRHLARLGGLRGKDWHVAPKVNALWQNRSFHNYADYALSPDFRAGLNEAMTEGRARRCTLMCSEALWWRCHRRIVADYLIAADWPVFHIMAEGRFDPAALTTGAEVAGDGRIFYPAPPDSEA